MRLTFHNSSCDGGEEVGRDCNDAYTVSTVNHEDNGRGSRRAASRQVSCKFQRHAAEGNRVGVRTFMAIRGSTGFLERTTIEHFRSNKVVFYNSDAIRCHKRNVGGVEGNRLYSANGSHSHGYTGILPVSPAVVATAFHSSLYHRCPLASAHSRQYAQSHAAHSQFSSSQRRTLSHAVQDCTSQSHMPQVSILSQRSHHSTPQAEQRKPRLCEHA